MCQEPLFALALLREALGAGHRRGLAAMRNNTCERNAKLLSASYELLVVMAMPNATLIVQNGGLLARIRESAHWAS